MNAAPLLATWCLFLLSAAVLQAQDASQANEPASADSTAASQPTSTPDFDRELAAWKHLLGQLRELQVRHKVAKPQEQKTLQEEYNKLLAQGEQQIPKVVQAAMESYQKYPNQNEQVSRFLVSRAATDVKNDRYEEALAISKLLIQHDFPNPAVNEYAGTAAFALNDYDAAEKYLTAAKEKKSLSDEGQAYLDEIPKYRELWQKEQQLRQAEAKANDLPRVELKTTKGNIVLELFENEAPNTVANFINLVEKGFYNNLLFHRVIHGFMAQGGDPKGDGTGGPGYTIACECYQPNHRNHFAGSLSMANTGQRDTGGSQFFITYRPTPHLNGKHTVFGRVIQGMDVVQKLKETKNRTSDLDKILEARVLRKREHEYKPMTLAGK
jgi:cyclophilin family peptidyl-prolyl cis-trans isomerase